MSYLIPFFYALCVSLVATKIVYQHDLENIEIHFEEFIATHDKVYAHEQEKQARFEIFKENFEKIIKRNEGKERPIYGVNKFMDQTHEERLSKYTGIAKGKEGPILCPLLTDKDIDFDGAPEAFDWRDHGAVTPVRNQENCGSCYAFSAAGCAESQYAIKHKEFIDLAEQQIVDCDKYNNACAGGLMSAVYMNLQKVGGIMNEGDYPYQGTVTNCTFDKEKVFLKISDCRSYNLTSQEKLKQLLYHVGPVAIAIDASNLFDVESYNTIIPDEDCDGGLNHGVLLVGYGTENGTPFWIVKNSWGADWAGTGYFRMARGENAISCGVMNDYMAMPIIE